MNADGMGTAEWRAAKSPAYYKRGDYVPGLKVSLVNVFFDALVVMVYLLMGGFNVFLVG